MSLAAALRDLLRPAAYPHAVDRVLLIETPISWVLLAGDFAYKIKRPVRLNYADQRSAQRRAELCAEELRLNRRFAPDLYLGVQPITRSAGRLVVGGAGEVVEQAVWMRRFNREQELDRLVRSGGVTVQELADFGRGLAEIHTTLPVATEADSWGTPGRVRALVLENLEQCRAAALACDSAAWIDALRVPLTAALDAATALMTQRHDAGRVRECHGDLHAGNIVRLDGRLLAFDCVEFEPAFRWIDVADDVAFLVADLETLAAPRHATRFLQVYVDASGDWQSCRVLPLYQAHHALVRAKVTALSTARHAVGRATLRQLHAAYLGHAQAALQPRRPMLLLMSGLSGSGKTWLATQLASQLPALHLRSDVERKRRRGLEPLAASGVAVAQELYSAATTAALYRHLLGFAADVLAGGRTVIADATFLRVEERSAWRESATAAGVRCRVIRCHAASSLLRQRIERRRALANDASEADLQVLEWQLRCSDEFAAEEQAVVIDADTSRDDVVAQVLRRLG